MSKSIPARETPTQGKVLLVSAPWALFNRPSLPLGSLKAYLSAKLPGLQVQSSHLFLKVAQALGYGTYQRVSQRVWRAEAIFSALLYPDRRPASESLFYRTFKKREVLPFDFAELVHQSRTIIDDWLKKMDWSTLDLVGFTVSFCQVTASLYLIAQIKRIRPSLPVVVGGSSFSGERSADLMRAFPGIDYLVQGEGERPLTELLRLLLTSDDRRSKHAIPDGVLTPEATKTGERRFCQLDRLDGLAVPDYDDYFSLMAGFPPEQRFFPTLSIEASRGCWWHRSDRSRRFKGCSFCNLNLQWQGYRTKSPRQVVHEVEHLVQRHQVLSLSFADNAFPLNRADAIFEGIEKLGLDLSIFAELRANTTPVLLQKMKQAGVDTVQIGIEALSSRLLIKMNKGARAIDNLSLMKHCEAAGITNASNLMLHFPSSDADDVNETLNALDFSRWFRPLKTVSFWLGLESPIYRFPDRFHVRCAFNHPNLKKLFPASLANAMRFIIQGYRGDRKRQLPLWRPVETRVRQWEADYAVLQRQTGGKPALMFHDGTRFLIIDQQFPGKPPVKHRLTGISAQIYRYCDIPRSLDQLTGRFISHRPAQIRAFLNAMVDKRLMFEEKNCYLSLASPATWPA